MYNAKKKKKFRKYEVCILEQTKHTPEDNDFFFFFLKESGHTQSEEMNKTWQPVTTEY